jgi:hypothetical protein
MELIDGMYFFICFVNSILILYNYCTHRKRERDDNFLYKKCYSLQKRLNTNGEN